mmetsp:Transcript_64127/g.149326  ORF Transcript_64127/g.149326 Transcript_64127/m.149326 type:complete len:157 (+) Transcript_64127:26-496(+)
MGPLWVHLAACAALLGSLCCGSAQTAPTPPPAPPTLVPPTTAPSPPPPPQVFDADAHMHASRERHLKDLAPSGVHHEQGHWVYGDYKSVPEVKSPIECAKACEADEGCLHWNFHVVHHHCDLKSESSGHNNGVPDWISGNAMRYTSRMQPKRPAEL